MNVHQVEYLTKSEHFWKNIAYITRIDFDLTSNFFLQDQQLKIRTSYKLLLLIKKVKSYAVSFSTFLDYLYLLFYTLSFIVTPNDTTHFILFRYSVFIFKCFSVLHDTNCMFDYIMISPKWVASVIMHQIQVEKDKYFLST